MLIFASFSTPMTWTPLTSILTLVSKYHIESYQKITIVVNRAYVISVQSYHCNGYLWLLLVAKYHVMATFPFF